MEPRGTPPNNVRQEIFSLGGRHLGDALGGARRELLNGGLSQERRRLLLAVVRHLELEPVSGPAVAAAAAALPVWRWRYIGYAAALSVFAVWAVASLLRLLG